MGKVKELQIELDYAVEVFGDFQQKFVIASDEDNVTAGDIITLINSNCEVSFDNARAVFEDNLLYYYIVDLELLETDYNEYVPEKSNNGGCYAYAKCKVVKVYEKTY